MEREYINDKETFFTKIEDLPQLKVGKLLGKFIYYKCDTCGEIKEKRIYSENRQVKLDFTCRECKYKKTSIEKFGTENPAQLSNVVKKRNETMMKRYGTVSTTAFIDYKKIDYESRNKKSKKTNLEKYGVDNVAKAEEIKEKIKKTCIDRYGFNTASQNELVKEKERNTIIEKYGDFKNMPGPKACHEKFMKQRTMEADDLDLEWLDYNSFRGKYDNGPIYYTFKCRKCGNVFKDDFHSGKPICRTCNPKLVGESSGEKEIIEYVKSLYRGCRKKTDESSVHRMNCD